jgi:hypothetical protein
LKRIDIPRELKEFAAVFTAAGLSAILWVGRFVTACLARKPLTGMPPPMRGLKR